MGISVLLVQVEVSCQPDNEGTSMFILMFCWFGSVNEATVTVCSFMVALTADWNYLLISYIFFQTEATLCKCLLLIFYD